MLARHDLVSPHRVARYGVNRDDLERIGVPAIEGPSPERTRRDGRDRPDGALLRPLHARGRAALDSPIPVLGTIQDRRNSFLDAVATAATSASSRSPSSIGTISSETIAQRRTRSSRRAARRRQAEEPEGRTPERCLRSHRHRRTTSRERCADSRHRDYVDVLGRQREVGRRGRAGLARPRAPRQRALHARAGSRGARAARHPARPRPALGRSQSVRLRLSRSGCSGESARTPSS